MAALEHDVDSEARPRARLTCWGDFALSCPTGNRSLAPRGRKARALVAYLALHRGRPVRRERLTGLLWGDRGEEQARASLRQALQELKPLANGLGLIAIDRDTVSLDPAAVTTDIDLLDGAAKAKAWDALIALLPEPHEQLFSDLDGLDSGFDDWLAIERARQGEALVSFLADAQAEALRSGAAREARVLAARLRERDPDASVARALSAPVALAASPTMGVPPSASPAQRIVSRRMVAAVSTALLAAAAIVTVGTSGTYAPRTPAQGDVARTSGEVHSLYLRARAKIRERNPKASEEGRALLERAVALDGDYAPVLASLSQLMWLTGERDEAGRLARRALAHAPDLADAHAAMALALRFEGQRARRHIQRAVELDPSSPDYLYWLGHAYSNALDYPRALTAYRRAHDLDPTWEPPAQVMIEMAWSMGRREEAISHLRRLERQASPYQAGLLRGGLAMQAGDMSQAADAFQLAKGATDDLGKEAVAVGSRAVVLLSLGYVEAALREFAECRWRWAQGRSSALQMPEFYAAHLALQRGTLPPAARLAELNRSQRDYNAQVFVREVAAKLIALGRANEALALYDGPDGLLGFGARRPLPASAQHLAGYGPTVAGVLVAVGRQDEARRLLLAADQQIRMAFQRSRGEVPANVWAAAAETWAMLGKETDALIALERAVRTGWINVDALAQDLPDDIADEPAFAALRGQSRFKAIRAELNGRLARERAETAPALT